MGVSAYLVDNSNKDNIKGALVLYYVQLFVNLMWPVLFFGFKQILLSLGLLGLLIILVIILIVKFNKINKVSAYLLIPYLAWLLFAFYLNLQAFLLN